LSAVAGSTSIQDRLFALLLVLTVLNQLSTVELRLRVFGVTGAQSTSNSALRDVV
jgi:hypothetical protein